MTFHRYLLPSLVLSLLLLLGGCEGKPNPEYYQALNEVVTFLEALKLPEADQVTTENKEFQEALAKFGKLNEKVAEKVDPAASKSPSYAAYEKAVGDLIYFTQNYKKYYLSSTVNEPFEQSDVEKVVVEGKAKLDENIKALKAALAQENP